MFKILIIQSRRRPEMLQAEQGEYARAAQGAELFFKNSLDASLPWSEPEKILEDADALILCGSGEFDFDGGRNPEDEARAISRAILERLRPLIAFVTQNSLPTLGICYGHQIIAEAHGVRVIHDMDQNKVGTFPVTLTEAGKNDALLKQLPQIFLAQYGHKDSLTALPLGATLLATGARCRFSALRYSPTMYTFQFHPELTAQDVTFKLANSPGYLPEGTASADLVKESPEASTLIPRFLGLFS